MHVLAQILIAGEQAVVGVDARGTDVVVTGAEVHIVAQVAVFTAYYQQHLGVRLVADHAVYDMGTGFLQAIGQCNVGFFVEAGAQLHHHRHLLAAPRGVHQCVHHQ